MTEFDRDEAIMSSVLDEPIHGKRGPLNPTVDESNRETAHDKGHKTTNVATDAS